jgi:putative chitinase
MATPFDFDFTLEQATEILANNPEVDQWYAALTMALPEFDIYNRKRVAAFLAQTAHESNNYTALHENLNYRAASLIKTWPKRFDEATAAKYEHHPILIANKVYANRMGNGDEASNDSWTYRGRGIIQITGKDNYRACSMALYGDLRLIDNPELLEEDKLVAVQSACWFWNSKGLNELADDDRMKDITYRINGGYNGEDDRNNRYAAAMTYFQDDSVA